MVSVLVPIRNEVRVLRETLPLILGQRLDEEIEFLLLDGRSDDGTLEILAEFAAVDERVTVLDNPGRRQTTALNIGLAAAKGDYICRMDAHTRYPLDYIRTGVERLRRGDVVWVAGPAIAVGVDRWSRRVALALSSRLGVGGGRFRLSTHAEFESDAAFGGVLTTEMLHQVGGWDEKWLVNEDGEIAARVLAEGGRILCVPQMSAEFIARNSLPKLARQYWRYGRGRAKTWLRHPRSLRRSHLLPPALVFMAAGAIVTQSPARRFCRAGVAAYGGLLVVESARLSRQTSCRDAAWLPLVFATMHLTWGSGFLLAALAGLRSPRS